MAEGRLARALAHLERLVGFDTRNPPRAIGAGGANGDSIFGYLTEHLRQCGFALDLADHGAGCVSLHAQPIGVAPRLLFNFHLDTVPDAGGWSTDPHRLMVDGGRARGLGACDTKGAAACMLAAVESHAGAGDAALLFTSDEEAGDDRCVKAFLQRRLPFAGVLVSEPTSNRAVLGHRGIATAVGVFAGTAGHGSAQRALRDSALHESVRWATAALALAEEEEGRAAGGLAGVRFNLGVLHGGKKSNMIADRAEVRFGVRPRPGEDPLALLARFQGCARDPARVSWHTGFVGPPLPAPGAAAAERLAAELRLAAAAPADFWSEASLFSAAGHAALVFGPGDIAQAHAADEWVALADLDAAAAAYERLLGRQGS